ncbi:MAG TPA: PP2C family protein-serine/threonine phosphatase [Actinomycetota bacterium]|nr:PP2C family protein-serine/threonine phosphatase [Actinomycetota bacterium]
MLAAAEDAAPVDAVDAFAEHLLHALGATEVSFLIADFSGGAALMRLGHTSRRSAGDGRAAGDGRETAERVMLAGSPHEQALQSQTVIVEKGDMTRLFAPVTNRGEAIGILELVVPDAPDDTVLAAVSQAAHTLAYVVIANRRFTDLFEWGRRSVKLSLAAEIQHSLLPGTYVCEAGQFTLAAWLEPAGEIAGDTFDFSMERDVLHLSMTDAMGHEVQAAVLATVLVSALRNARRGGGTLGDQVRVANELLCPHLSREEFVTGQVVRIDLRRETAIIVNAGHPPPMRLRNGQVQTVELEVDPPFGISVEQEYRVQEFPLTPGDRLIFLSDGMLERNAAPVDIDALLLQGADLHPREAVQHLVRTVVESTVGPLKDDATVFCLDWHGGPERERATKAGSNQPESRD